MNIYTNNTSSANNTNSDTTNTHIGTNNAKSDNNHIGTNITNSDINNTNNGNNNTNSENNNNNRKQPLINVFTDEIRLNQGCQSTDLLTEGQVEVDESFSTLPSRQITETFVRELQTMHKTQVLQIMQIA